METPDKDNLETAETTEATETTKPVEDTQESKAEMEARREQVIRCSKIRSKAILTQLRADGLSDEFISELFLTPMDHIKKIDIGESYFPLDSYMPLSGYFKKPLAIMAVELATEDGDEEYNKKTTEYNNFEADKKTLISIECGEQICMKIARDVSMNSLEGLLGKLAGSIFKKPEFSPHPDKDNVTGEIVINPENTTTT